MCFHTLAGTEFLAAAVGGWERSVGHNRCSGEDAVTILCAFAAITAYAVGEEGDVSPTSAGCHAECLSRGVLHNSDA